MLKSQGLLLVMFMMGVLAGCGGSSSRSAPPPTGPFSNSNFSGTYALSLSGNNAGGFFSIVGSIQANGSGNITGGLLDVNTAAGVFLNQSVSGTYAVQANGQGIATLNTSIGTFNIDFVLISAQRGLVMRFDNVATASGALDLQDSTAFTAATLQGSFAFNIGGIDASNQAMASAGAFTATSGGAVSTGVQDINDNGTINSNLAVSGSYVLGATNGRGTIALTTTLGTLNFVFYIVDANHLKLLETDVVPVLAGEAFRQQGTPSNASLSGPQAFTVSGAQGNFPYAAGGIFTADGAGNITTGVEDFNSGGSVTRDLSLSGSYSIDASGRGTLTLSTGTGASNFVVYTSTGGLLMLETDITVVNNGTAFSQQTGTFSTSSLQGTFGWNLTGVTTAGEVDEILQFTMDGGGHFTGSLDVNNTGFLSSGLLATGTYSVSANGHGTMVLQSSVGTQSFVIYTVSNSRALFIGIDSSLISVGEFDHQ